MSDDQLLSVRASVDYLNTLPRQRQLIERTFLNIVDRGEIIPDKVEMEGKRPRRYFRRETLDAWHAKQGNSTEG